jgi:hypothetical protein
VEADVFTSTAGNNDRTIRRERLSSIGVLERGEHERVIYSVPGRPLAFLDTERYLAHKEHFV